MLGAGDRAGEQCQGRLCLRPSTVLRPHVSRLTALCLEVAEFSDADHWRFVLKEAGGAFLADHSVALDRADQHYAGMVDLPCYLRLHSAPDTRYLGGMVPFGYRVGPDSERCRTAQSVGGGYPRARSRRRGLRIDGNEIMVPQRYRRAGAP
jgi:hypothetical protein